MKPFQSYLMAGFECADHINRNGDRINLLKETAHDIRVEEDYRALIGRGITTVREGICWSTCEPMPYCYNFSEVENRIRTASALGIQQIWDVCHFGFPDDLSPTHPKFSHRFAALCTAFVRFYKETTNANLFIVPINEISFLSWHAGDVRGTVPFMVNSGWDLKYHLCKAAIAGIEAILQADSAARILTVEPLVYVHAKDGMPYTDNVKQQHEYQYQAMDIIAGRMCPELGGKEEYLDILGFNYYHNCQWEHQGTILGWPADKHRSVPLLLLLQEAWQRYEKSFIISETGHFGDGRAQWLNEVVKECKKALLIGLPLKGICLYPIIDRPDWDDLNWYHNSGLFDVDESKNRIPNPSYDISISKVQQDLYTPVAVDNSCNLTTHILNSGSVC